MFDGKKATNHIKTCIINPKRSSNFAKAIGNRSKTDKIDAKTLYAFKNLINPSDIKVPEIDKDVEVLSAYLSSYEFIIKVRVSISNHIKALKYNANTPKGLLDKITEYIEKNEELKTELNYLDRIREELGIMEGLQNKQELQEVC